ncbi:MAG: hypothetical protein AM1032_000284 [Mycoplasmataceae bacterium]|nr:MAG: hypothetical protein AM1032_000284 [Mycoplasmataceae bacterium]
MEQKNITKERNWKIVNSSSILLTIFIFLSIYFPVIIRYNINSLFNPSRHGFFDFFVLIKDLGMIKSENIEDNNKFFNWIFFFSSLMLVFYFFDKISNIFSNFYKEKSKIKLEKEICKDFLKSDDANIDYQAVSTFSSKIIDSLSFFLLGFFDLFIELWSAVKINMNRNIKIVTWKQASFCLFLVIFYFALYDYLLLKISKNNKSNDKKNFLFHVKSQLEKLKFSNSNTLFFSFYFLIISKNYSFVRTELINIILLSGNIHIIISKLRSFIKLLPETRNNFYLWKNKSKDKKSLLI